MSIESFDGKFQYGPVILAADKVHEPLWAVVPYFNPWRHKSRVKHTERALKHFHDAGATIVLVEVGFNRRDLIFADSGIDGTPSLCGILGKGSEYRHKYIGLHTKDSLWLKENAINIGVQNLPYNWQQMCYLDADVHFVRPNWVGETIHQLQHYAVLQMFSQARDLAPNYEMLPHGYPHAEGIGFVSAWRQGTLKTTLSPAILADLKKISEDIAQLAIDFKQLEQDEADAGYGYDTKEKRVFPGLAWAFRRDAFDALGGMLDFAVWGGADWHMGHALIEKTENMMHPDLHENYKKLVMEWYERCRINIRRNVGVMEGCIFHNWHGKKTARHYNEKHNTLAKYKFDPLKHLKKDSAGVYQLHDPGDENYVQLRDMLRSIAKARNEDGTEI